MIDKIKNITWLVTGLFTIFAFIQTLLALNPRVTKVEERMSHCEERYNSVETRVSGIEIKLDAIYSSQQEQGKDIKDIYHLILDRHK